MKRLLRRKSTWWALAFLALCAGAAASGSLWLPELRHLVAASLGESHSEKAAPALHADENESDAAAHDHDGTEQAKGLPDDADHAAKPQYDHPHDDAAALALSTQAKATIGVRPVPVKLGEYQRAITVPGIIVERPGWTTLEVTAPMTGVVTRIHPIQGEAVQPGQALFEVRLTHEDLLQKQTEFLRSVEELDVIDREVSRLEKVAGEGAIAGKTLLERQYEQRKHQAALRAQRQALLLHGLSKDQVENIEKTRVLLQSLTVTAPLRENRGSPVGPALPAGDTSASRRFQVQELKVSQGSYVTAGAILCRLVDHAELDIEGKAFEEDVPAISRAASERWTVSASLGTKAAGAGDAAGGLAIRYLDDKVDPESRAFRFYVALPNHVVREDKAPDGRHFVYWRFKPGQRTQIKVPVETWTSRIVLPADAVVQDGLESYVFEINGDHFDRRPVHVEYRDQESVVIANDGALRPGVTVAGSAAHQMQMAMKNQAGGAVDPHAGHNH
jgi:multidrug efflux pump subunit AcrA (membrane-fusion protein)